MNLDNLGFLKKMWITLSVRLFYPQVYTVMKRSGTGMDRKMAKKKPGQTGLGGMKLGVRVYAA
ncbi:MAG: hypothetical protein PHT57_02650, partial [Rhodoferax sp.]|nr:hypothetical protein [Rhodoferax sp.]